ncbi:MAG: hypothetical protein ABIG71_00935 [Candidatus Uhrbacteria bacterium]
MAIRFTGNGIAALGHASLAMTWVYVCHSEMKALLSPSLSPPEADDDSGRAG